jgi:hypothetical protein
MCIPDEHFSRIQELLKDKKSMKLKDAKGQESKFYYHTDGTLMADRWTDENTLVQQEVIKMSEIPALQHSINTRPFRENMIFKLKQDFPDMKPEDVEVHADILAEANESIKKLIASGVPPNVASQIIQDVLADKKLLDELTKEETDIDTENSAHALAEILREKEILFGNPKEYDNDDN